MLDILYSMSREKREIDYYNDMPGKVPPDVGTPPVPPLPNLTHNAPVETTRGEFKLVLEWKVKFTHA